MDKSLKQYIGECVAIYLKNPIMIGVDESTGQSMVSVALRGYVISIDKYFIHIGDNPEEVTKSVVLSELNIIELRDEMDEAMELVDVPEDTEFH